jgi:hypothetical protein
VYVNLSWAFGQLIAAGVLSGFSNGATKWAYKIPVTRRPIRFPKCASLIKPLLTLLLGLLFSTEFLIHIIIVVILTEDSSRIFTTIHRPGARSRANHTTRDTYVFHPNIRIACV